MCAWRRGKKGNLRVFCDVLFTVNATIRLHGYAYDKDEPPKAATLGNNTPISY